VIGTSKDCCATDLEGLVMSGEEVGS